MKSYGGNATTMRTLNRQLLRDALRNRDRSNLSQLARDTCLSIATCANIIHELLDSGVAFECEERESRGGRPARVYGFNPAHAHAVSLLITTLGGTVRFRHRVYDAAGTMVDEGDTSRDGFHFTDLHAVLDDAIARWPTAASIAVSVPGVVNGGLVEVCDVQELEGVDLHSHLVSRYGMAIILDNDMNLAALGYQGNPVLPQDATLAYVVLDINKCPGCGLVVNGRLTRGKSNFAGEVSFIPFGAAAASTVVAAGRIAAALVAVVNPHVVVFSGDAAHELDSESVRAVCRQTVPPQHLPDLIIRPEYMDDAFAGMRRLGLENLGGDMVLVEKEDLA
ncbi:MAG: ROK family protein [Planctomycetaceae bacterium]|nr:ROK family protein [Planctomycetaceae bacterium]